MAGSRALSGKRLRFADEYLVDRNAAGAYRRAGYKAKSPHVAASSASKLLASPVIAAYVAQHEAALSEKTGVTAEWVRRELKANHERYKYGDEPGHASASTKCLELLGKDQGMFEENVNLRLGFAALVAKSGGGSL